MARKGKIGINYFSHDVDMLNDRKIKLIKAKHGLVGYAVYLRLLEELYRENGYYLVVNDDFNILFSDENNLDYNAYILILNDCINHSLFDKNLFDKFGILTSKRVQENYLAATERRKEVQMFDKYMLIDLNDADINDNNVNIIPLNDDIGTQSKVKRKESKKKVSRFTPPTLAEVKKYCTERKNNVDSEKFIDFYESKGWVVGKVKMRDWKASVRTWEKSDKPATKQTSNAQAYQPMAKNEWD